MKQPIVGASLLLAVSVVGAEPETPLRALPAAEQSQCAAFGETYLRLAEMRDAGAEKMVAINRGVEYLGKLGSTGTHVRGNYKDAVASFAEFVYANPRLNNRTLYLYGISSCAISKMAPDDKQFDTAMTGLEKKLGRCQVQFPEDGQVRELGTCVLDPVNKQLDIWANRRP